MNLIRKGSDIEKSLLFLYIRIDDILRKSYMNTRFYYKREKIRLFYGKV